MVFIEIQVIKLFLNQYGEDAVKITWDLWFKGSRVQSSRIFS